MGAPGRIIDVKYDEASAHLILSYSDGTERDVDLLAFDSMPFESPESRAKKLQRFVISEDGKSVYFPDHYEMTYTEERGSS